MQLQLKSNNLKENDSKSFYAYVRSKQNVQDNVGPLEDSAGNIISQGFLMAEDLNGYFSSVFTKEDISSLPVADAKFQEAKSDYLGSLVVTPEMVAKKIKAMKDNKSPGVDGIPPKLLMETVEQISLPLARVFNLSLKEGVVLFEWKEANIIPLFGVGRDSIPVRRPDYQSREPGFKSHCGRFEPLASLITPRCHSSLSCINEYM